MRLIDADALINDIEKLINEHEEMMKDSEEHPENYPEDYETRMMNFIAGLISAKVEADYAPIIDAGWIPCSEKLPNAEDCPMDCMVTRQSKYVGNYTDMAVAEADGTWTHEDWKAITIKGKVRCISTRDADIIAWMPLPKPYREESEGEK